MEENVTLLAAFGAGLLSFISPCVLPLIPGYLSYISGLSLDEMRGATPVAGGSAVAVAAAAPLHVRRRILLSSLAFIAGFTLVFVAIGATASAVGQFVNDRLPMLGRIAGDRHHLVRPAHDGGVADRIALPGKTGADPAASGRVSRRDARGDCVRVRMDALYRPDPQRHPVSGRLAGHGRKGRPAPAGLLTWPRRAILRHGAGAQPASSLRSQRFAGTTTRSSSSLAPFWSRSDS